MTWRLARLSTPTSTGPTNTSGPGTDSTMANATVDQRVERVGRELRERSLTMAVCESLTSGTIAASLGAVPGAGEWFSAGVLANRPEVKARLFGLPVDDVVSGPTALAMADGVRRLTGSAVGVGVTGVGGAGPQDGIEAGTVFAAVVVDGIQRFEKLAIPEGEPAVVIREAARHTYALIRTVLAEVDGAGPSLRGSTKPDHRDQRDQRRSLDAH